ncbi:drug/metabolite transporter (DMT)-like permease [Elusimicrobium simillimum]|uniref:DMT family transporter n=1 Tax=Elusimicrobium simillimum TaxID=3143438 RepID=UPI003C6EC683
MIYVKLAVAIFFWGLTFLFTKMALTDVSITTLVLVRSTLGLGVVALFLREFAWIKQVSASDWCKFAFLAMIGILIQQHVQGYAILHTSTNHAGWLNAFSPVVVAFIMVVFFKEHLPINRATGFLVCMLGVVLIFFSKQAFVDGSAMPTSKGDIIIVLTAINWAFYVIPMSIWFKNMPNLRVTFCILMVVVLVLLPLEFIGGFYKDFTHISPKALWSMVYLGICCSGFALLFYNEGVEKIGASKASAFLYVQPLITTAFGYLVLGEKINKEAVIGGVLIMVGLYLINVRRQHVKKFYITLIRYFRV